MERKHEPNFTFEFSDWSMVDRFLRMIMRYQAIVNDLDTIECTNLFDEQGRSRGCAMAIFLSTDDGEARDILTPYDEMYHLLK